MIRVVYGIKCCVCDMARKDDACVWVGESVDLVANYEYYLGGCWSG
jgi:hypothetical protein